MRRAATIGLLGLFAVAALPRPVPALSTDSQQPIHIEADRAELDEERRVTIYKGSVVVVQGSMRINADRVDFFYNEERGLDKAVALGKPARYEQLPDDSQDVVRARARRMEYYASKNLLYLIEDARVTQRGDTVTGDRITYDMENNKARAERIEEDDERIRVVIHPKKESSDEASGQKP